MDASQIWRGLKYPLKHGLNLILGVALISPTLAHLAASAEQIPQFNQPPLLVEPTSPSLLTSARQTYPITINLPADAGTAIASIQIRQSDPKQALGFDLSQTTAAQTAVSSRSRLSTSLPIQSMEQVESNQIQINFAQHEQPGNTITILLKPQHLPTGHNHYPLTVSALPVGAETSTELGQQQLETCRSRYDGQGDRRTLFWDLSPEFDPRLRDHPCQR